MRSLIIFGLGAASLAAQANEDATPRLVILSGQNQIRRLADVTFSRRNPPPQLREDAMTRCQVELYSEVPRKNAGLKWQPGSCRAEAHVEEVRVRVGLTIEVFLPKRPPRVLRAHEEGHAQLCREIFKAVAAPAARRVYREFPGRFAIESKQKCSAVELQERAFQKLDELDKGLAQRVEKEIMRELGRASRLFDRLTRGGRADGKEGGPATVRGQQQAVLAVMRKMKQKEAGDRRQETGRGEREKGRAAEGAGQNAESRREESGFRSAASVSFTDN